MDTTEALLLGEARTKAKSGAAQKARESRALSRAEVAGLVEVSESTIFRWESGARKPMGEAGIRYGRILSILDHPA